MISVLFVCLGNICRSPMAEAVMRHKVEEGGFADQIHVESAGTCDLHVGESPHPGTQERLRAVGIAYDTIRARHLQADDVRRCTYVVVMDDKNLADVQKLNDRCKHKVIRFVDLIPDTEHTHVPDPWFTGDFHTTYQLVEEGCRHLLRRICKEHQLDLG
ncbi:low molecular weight protein-tyrosine-phosphatase [Pasteuria penetrans]|uniref:low molecular weight protein-tyrosine-phosphatase n=1 Tax=Pasteuria penetrans TaxID=86005 RepID=UPI000F95791C|nr:low molecular weight protein-tyrosine-phosphatase [Pasteuria penetrans]